MDTGVKSFRSVEFNDQIPEIMQSPTFLETTAASLAYKYNPLFDRLAERGRFGDLAEEGFVAMDHIPEDLKGIAASAGLLRATNQEHMDFLVDRVRDRMDVHKTLDNSGLFAQFGAEIFDPINYIALPMRGAATGLGAGLRAGAATAAVTAGQEAIRYPFDPLGTKTETAINIGASFVIGGVLGGAASIPAGRRAAAVATAQKEIDTLDRLLNPESVDFDANIAPSVFTDSPLYSAVSTPMKRVLQNEAVPNDVKLTMLKIANDAGILLAGNKRGLALQNSVYQNANLRNGEWIQSYDTLLSTWGESTGKGVVAPMDYLYKRADFEAWVEAVDAKIIQGVKAADEYEQKAMDALNGFYTQWEGRLRETGMIGDAKYFKRSVEFRTQRVAETQSRIDEILAISESSRSSRDVYQLSRLEAKLQREKNILDEHTQALEEMKSQPVLPPNEEVFRPRFWNKDVIRANMDEFKKVLGDWYTENPYIYERNTRTNKFEKVFLGDAPEEIASRVDATIKSILNEIDETNPDTMNFGAGVSKHFRHRSLDIPNARVLKFMHTNPIAIMKAYTARVAPRYEFERSFAGRSIDDVMDDISDQMYKSGADVDTINAASRDVRYMYDRVVGSIGRNVDRWDNKLAEGLKTAAQLNFLGSAFAATFSEPAKIVMEHGIGPTMRGLFSVFKDNQLKLGAYEGRIAAGITENVMHTAHMRLVDDMTNNPLRTTMWDKAKDAFYLLNGLGPITRMLKDFDSMVRVHSLIDYSVRLTKNQATQQEIEYLARYGIDADMAQKIANAPWQKSESGMYMANTEAWTNTIEFPATTADIQTGPTNSYAGNRYKPALYRKSENRIYIDEDYIRDVMWHERSWENSRVEGVRPIKEGIINSPDDLVTFVKMHEIMHTIHSAKDLGFDARTKEGKAAYENAINDLAIAEIEKQPRVSEETVQTFRNALGSGIMNTIMMGTPADKPIITDGIVLIPMRVAQQFGMKEDPRYTGYARIESGLLGLPFQFYSYALAATNKTLAAYGHGQLKNQYLGTALAIGLGYMTLQYKTPDYVEMTPQDQFARALDYSGVAALYTDMFYTAMSTSLALGGPNLTGGFIAPRFPQKPSTTDAITGLAGAGPAWAATIGNGMIDLVTGNVGEGTKDIVRALPFARLWFIKDQVNRYTNMFAEAVDDPTGFKRY